MTAATCRSLWVSTPPMTTRLVGGMLAMSASLRCGGQVDASLAEGGGQDSDGTLARLSSGHTVDEAGASPGAPRPPTDPRKDNASRLSVGVWVRKPGSVPAPASCASIAVWVRKPRSTGLHILTVGVDGELAVADALFGDGVGQQPLGQAGGLTGGDHPARHVARVDVEDQSGSSGALLR